VTPDDPAWELLKKLDADLAGATLDDAGEALAYLVGKWINEIPASIRQTAMMDFSERVGDAIRAFRDQQKQVRH